MVRPSNAITQRDGQFLIKRWMKFKPYTVKPLDSVTYACTLLEEHRINQLPVVTNGRLVGIVTDRDLRDAWSVANANARARKPGEIASDRIPVKAVMTANASTVSPNDSLEKAAELMRQKRIGALPVVERGHLRGIITRSDILDAFLELRTGEATKQTGTRRRKTLRNQ